MLAIYPNFRPHHGRNEGGSPAMFECKLVASKRQTAFGPLCLLGHYLSQEGVLKPLSSVHIVQKSIKHSPTQKLIDALMGILSGCKALYEIDVRVRPDAPLQRAFSRERCADQSAIQRTLNAFTPENVARLREAVEALDVCCVDWVRDRKGAIVVSPHQGEKDGPSQPYSTPRAHGRGPHRPLLPHRRRLRTP